jgi:hypothetical protein
MMDAILAKSVTWARKLRAALVFSGGCMTEADVVSADAELGKIVVALFPLFTGFAFMAIDKSALERGLVSRNSSEHVGCMHLVKSSPRP